MAETCNGNPHECKDGSAHSPAPWKVVRSTTPFMSWLMDATGGVVCMGFGASDESLLLATPALLRACERLVAGEEGAEALADAAIALAYRSLREKMGNG